MFMERVPGKSDGGVTSTPPTFPSIFAKLTVSMDRVELMPIEVSLILTSLMVTYPPCVLIPHDWLSFELSILVIRFRVRWPQSSPARKVDLMPTAPFRFVMI